MLMKPIHKSKCCLWQTFKGGKVEVTSKQYSGRNYSDGYAAIIATNLSLFKAINQIPRALNPPRC